MKRYASLFAIHIAVILLTLFFPIILPIIWEVEFFGVSLYWALYFIRYGVAVFLVSYFYGYKVDTHNLFLLPLSFAPLPFIFIPLVMVSGAGNVTSLMVFYEVIIYTALFLVLTVVFSFILHFKNVARRPLPCYSNEKTPKRIMLIGCAVFSVFAISIIVFNVSSYMRDERISKYTEYNQVMAVEMTDGFTRKQLSYFNVQHDSLIWDMSLRNSTKRITNAAAQHDFETNIGVTLPEIDFKNYYYLVLVGRQKTEDVSVGWVTEWIDINTIIVYQVNIVR